MVMKKLKKIEIEEGVYWRGKCDECKYSSGFSSKYGLYWFCEKYQVPMFVVNSKCPGNKFYK